jgi:hypothetical protein
MMEDAESLWTVVASVSCGGDEEQVSPVVNSVKFRLPDGRRRRASRKGCLKMMLAAFAPSASPQLLGRQQFHGTNVHRSRSRLVVNANHMRNGYPSTRQFSPLSATSMMEPFGSIVDQGSLMYLIESKTRSGCSMENLGCLLRQHCH